MNRLTDEDYLRAARYLGCDMAAVMAVAEVESPAGGFLPTGEPFILFEAHRFSSLTGHRYDASHPDISSRRRNGKLYRRGLIEHARLQAAVALDRDAALQSASWGQFQIMGSNWKRCGHPSLQSFINAMYRSAGDHLDAFVRFVESMGLADELQRHDWAGFARIYNGSEYAAHHYDERLALAHERHVSQVGVA